jgi:RNA polymerase sigma factor (sigma-70 family)
MTMSTESSPEPFAADGAEPGIADEEFPDDPVPGLVRAAAAGDARAWEQLVDRFAGLVWSICRMHRLSDDDAADVVQLTWLHLLENLERIRDPRRLAGWLATTCRRECLALLRKSRTSVTIDEERMDWLLGGAAPADELVLATDQFAALWQAFQRLSQWCQRVLRALIVDAEGGPPSYRVVASRLQTPVGSLGPTRARCLGQLRKLLDNGGI